MKKISHPLWLSAPLVGLLAACSPLFNWRDAAIDSGVKMQLPCAPKTQTRDVAFPEATSAKVAMTLKSCETDTITWAILSTRVSQTSHVEAALSALHAAALHNISAPPMSISASAPARQAIQVSGTRPDGSPVELYAKVFAQGQHVFQASVLAPPTLTAKDKEAIAYFFDNIQTTVAR